MVISSTTHAKTTRSHGIATVASHDDGLSLIFDSHTGRLLRVDDRRGGLMRLSRKASTVPASGLGFTAGWTTVVMAGDNNTASTTGQLHTNNTHLCIKRTTLVSRSSSNTVTVDICDCFMAGIL